MEAAQVVVTIDGIQKTEQQTQTKHVEQQTVKFAEISMS